MLDETQANQYMMIFGLENKTCWFKGTIMYKKWV